MWVCTPKWDLIGFDLQPYIYIYILYIYRKQKNTQDLHLDAQLQASTSPSGSSMPSSGKASPPKIWALRFLGAKATNF